MIQLPAHLVKETLIGKSIVRYGDIPAKKPLRTDTAILFVAGQKSPLERFFPFSEYFSQFYHTYNYEIPGMGVARRNPESPATIQELSREIEEFMSKTITEPNIIIFAGSAGFWFTTKAILDNEQLQKRVKKVVALFGLLGKDTFGFSRPRKAMLIALCKIMKTKPAVKFANWLLSHDWFINSYAELLIRRRHLGNLDPETQKEYLEFEKFLLKLGDWEIHFSTVEQYLTSDIQSDIKLEIPLLALYTPNDQFFPLEKQRLTFPRIFTKIEWVEIESKRHAPLIVKSWEDYRQVIPEKKLNEYLQ